MMPDSTLDSQRVQTRSDRDIRPVCRLIPIELHTDERGSLTTLQVGSDIPFAVQRVYTIFGVGPEARRGCHAHLRERQAIVCVSGRCTIQLTDGRRTETHRLDSPLQALLLEDVVWREMYDFSPDCVLMILSDSLYDPCDYIRDYGQFLAHVEWKGGEP